jgi:hypothetical protein
LPAKEATLGQPKPITLITLSAWAKTAFTIYAFAA